MLRPILMTQRVGQRPSGYGREHHLADPAMPSILTAGLPPRGMSVPVTNLLLSRCHLVGGGVPITADCTAQSNVSFLRSGCSPPGALPPESSSGLSFTKRSVIGGFCALPSFPGGVAKDV